MRTHTVCLYFAENDRLKFTFFFCFFVLLHRFLLSLLKNKGIPCAVFCSSQWRSQRIRRSNLKSWIFFSCSVAFSLFTMFVFWLYFEFFFFISLYTLLAFFSWCLFLLDARSLSLFPKTSCYFNIQTQFLRISTEIALSWSSNKIKNKLFSIVIQSWASSNDLLHRSEMEMASESRVVAVWCVGQERKNKFSHYHFPRLVVILLPLLFIFFSFGGKTFSFRNTLYFSNKHIILYFSVFIKPFIFWARVLLAPIVWIQFITGISCEFSICMLFDEIVFTPTPRQNF